MAIFVSKKRSSKETKKPSSKQKLDGSEKSLCRYLFQLPVALLFLILLFIWSSSSMIISGNFVHVCVSSRKLNNVYCLSAGTQPNFKLPIPLITSNTASNSSNNGVAMDEVGETVQKSSSSSSNNMDASESNEGILNAYKLVEEQMNIHHNTTNTQAVFDTVGVVKNSNSTSNTVDETDDEIVIAKKAVEEQMKIHRSWASKSNSKACQGRGIFVYDLPPAFNKDFLEQCNTNMFLWVNFCEHFVNNARGEPIAKLGSGWYHTHQYSLEPIFHSRVLKHPCRVYKEDEAKLFYVPYYGGLDILRWHFKNVTDNVKDSLGKDLMKWLGSQSSWTRNSGKDHVFVLGKISWDFRQRSESKWGSNFLKLDEMQNPLKLLIERQPWEINDIGIPHPTYFHPHADDDIIQWQTKVISSGRDSLVSFAGAERPDAPESIRSVLIQQCTSRNHTDCKFHDCKSGGCDKPETVIELFMESEFCLQPPGDSPTRKSVFDSLVSGCIPVLFNPFTAYYQYPWHLPEDHGLYSVFINEEDVRAMKVDVVERLKKISKKERDDIRRYIVYELLPRLVYGDSDSQLEQFEDAFSVSMNNLLHRVSSLGSDI